MHCVFSWCPISSLWGHVGSGPVPGHEDVSYRGQEGKTGLTAQAQQLVTDSDHDGEADDGSGSLHIQYLQTSGEEAVHSGDEDQEQHNDHPAESGSSGFNTEQEMEDSLKEFAEAAAALEKEYLDLPAGVMQPAAQEQHHLQNTDSQPAASLTLHLEDEKEKSDIPAYQTSSARGLLKAYYPIICFFPFLAWTEKGEMKVVAVTENFGKLYRSSRLLWIVSFFVGHLFL